MLRGPGFVRACGAGMALAASRAEEESHAPDRLRGPRPGQRTRAAPTRAGASDSVGDSGRMESPWAGLFVDRDGGPARPPLARAFMHRTGRDTYAVSLDEPRLLSRPPPPVLPRSR